MAHENNHPAAMTIRVNTAKTTIEEVIALLESEGSRSEKRRSCSGSASFQKVAIPQIQQAYKKGLITIQDESSMLPVLALDLSAWYESA